MNAKAGWIESPKYDLGLLSLIPLLGILVCGVAWTGVDPLMIGAVSLFLLGMPHYLSTYAFYMDDKTLDYAKTRKFAFFAGPVLIVLLLTVALKLKFYLLVAIWVDAWNVFHVSRQSNGILSIYRHLNGGNNLLERIPANLALVCISGGLYSLKIDKQQSFSHYFSMLPWNIMPYVGPALLLVGFAAVILLVVRMSRRSQSIFTSEMLFLGTSALLFAPYALLDSRSTATSAMLSGHYIQYMSILWLLNHRKYTSDIGSARQRMLAFISRSVPRILGLLVSLVIAASISDRVIHHFNLVGFHNWLLNVIVLLHFYLDGVFWAFKHPFTRQSIGPYLALPDHRVTPTVALPSPAMPVPVPAS